MAEKELESDDPYEFVAVRFPMDPGVDGDEAMARCFIEEYALMGMPRQKILQLFQARHFAGTYAILQKRGEPFVRQLIDEVFGVGQPQEVP